MIPPEAKTGADLPDDAFRRELRRRSRRGFAGALASVAAGAAGFQWFMNSPKEGRLNRAMRRALGWHERVGLATFRPDRLAREFPASSARMPIVNGLIGLFGPMPDWKLRVTGAAGKAREFTMAELRALDLPRVETTTELECVEGWTTVVRWSGVRLLDFAAKTGLASRTGRLGDPLAQPGDLLSYASLATPDNAYYVGLDMPSALHPQTLLCDAMNGQPLLPDHGAPLRLSIPVKYGFKSLKQLGSLHFTDVRPADFWAEQGYDWFAGL